MVPRKRQRDLGTPWGTDCLPLRHLPHFPSPDPTCLHLSMEAKETPLDWGLGVGRKSSRENNGNEKIPGKVRTPQKNRCFHLSQVLQEKCFRDKCYFSLSTQGSLALSLNTSSKKE